MFLIFIIAMCSLDNPSWTATIIMVISGLALASGAYILEQVKLHEDYTFIGWADAKGTIIPTTGDAWIYGEYIWLTAQWEGAQNFTFTLLGNGTYAVTGYEGGNNVVIPSTYNGIEVTEIGERAFENAWDITSVFIPATIVRIGDNAFGYNTFLGSVVIEEGSRLEIIDDYAFYSCYELSAFSIPETVIYIGDWAFAGCSLTEVVIPGGVIEIRSLAFAWNPIEYVVIPEGVTVIDYCAFEGAYFTSVTLPSTLLRIESMAFNGCSNLVNITIPDGVEKIGNDAFANCTSLASINVPLSVNDLDEYAFGSTGNMTMTIYYAGSVMQWRELFIDPDLSSLCNYSGVVFGDSTPFTVTVTFENDGMGASPREMTLVYGEAYVLPTLYAEGYIFRGWYSSAIGMFIPSSGDAWRYTEDMYLVALWDVDSGSSGDLDPEGWS